MSHDRPYYNPPGFDPRLIGRIECLTEPYFEYFADVFNLGLGLFISHYLVRIAELDPRIPGCYRHRWHQIVLNDLCFDRSPVDVFANLVHGMAHCHFRTYGPKAHSHGLHFNKLMASFGILCEDDGRHYAIVEGKFLSLLREYGVPTL